jgi:hypothetical protein
MQVEHNGLSKRLASGAAGGLAGAIALQGLRIASQRILPASVPPLAANPDDYLVMRAERSLPRSWGYAIPGAVDMLAARTLAMGYGALSGAAGAMVPPKGPILLRGTLLGLITWAIGYLGWLPKVGLMAPVQKQRPAQIAGPIVRHVLFGIVTVGVSSLLQRKSCD